MNNYWPGKILANNVSVFMNCWQYTECGLHSVHLLVFFWIVFNGAFLNGTAMTKENF